MTTNNRQQKPLTIRRLRHACRWLAERDSSLAKVLDTFGFPPLWNREPGLATMIHIILEQQVSLASANATFRRLQSRLSYEITPANFCSLADCELRELGFSRQKILYAKSLAESLHENRFSFQSLEPLDDDQAKTHLMQHKGIGHWSADIYLSECLLRPDILPRGDIAMQEAFRVLKNLDQRPSHEEFEAMTQHWRPWRSAGTRLLWHFYLKGQPPKSWNSNACHCMRSM